MPKKYYALIATAIFFAVLAAAWLLLKSLGIQLFNSREIHTQNAFVQAPISAISAQISAPILRVHAKDFAAVKQGDLLFELDCQDAELAAQKAQVAALQAAANIRSAQLASEYQQAECKAADADALAASARHEAAANEFARISKLHEHQAASSKQLDAAKEAASSALAAQSAAKAKAFACEKKSEQSTAAIRLAELAKDAADALLLGAGRDVSRCKIYAPLDGNLSAISAREGELVGRSNTLVRLIGRKRWLQANVKESSLDGLNVGDKAVFSVQNRSYEARVERISAASGNELAAAKIDNSVGNFIKITQRVPVLLSIKGGEELASGQSVKLTIYKSYK